MTWYAEQRQQKALVGRERRRKAWIALALTFFAYLTVIGARDLLG